ncbi:MAG: hypothetical protein J6K73_02105 [Clostridia bacterium]|nr:hypothetical protein [Clostridia bacterium]
MDCRNCPYGESGYSTLSDICDGCMHDPDTGFGGFTDHRVGRHFMTEQEQQIYYDNLENDDEYDDY